MMAEHHPVSLQARARSIAWRYGFAALSFLAALFIRFLLAPMIGGRPLLVLFVSAVLVSAIFAGLGPAILATGLVLTYDAVLKLRADRLVAADVINTLAFCLIVVEIYWVTERWSRERRSAEGRLAETEDFFAHILNALPNAVLVTDREGQILKRNRSCETTLGIPMGNIEGSNIEEYLSAEAIGKLSRGEGAARKWQSHREPVIVLQRQGDAVVAVEVQVREVQQTPRPPVLVWSIREVGSGRPSSAPEQSDLEQSSSTSEARPSEDSLQSARADGPSDDNIEILRSCYEALSDRERQVLEGLVAGQSNREIGLALHISPRTVESHRANVMSKMKARSFSDLVQMAFRLKSPGGVGGLAQTSSGEG